jgi:hypothetical protein
LIVKTVRGLLTQGNSKVGSSIHLWSVPAVETCPGRSAVCERVCYATKGRFLLDSVRERLAWCLEESRRDDFVERVVREIRRKGVLVLRVHAAGDFYDAAYAEKWLAVMQKCPRVKFYFYTRSWRVDSVAPVLEQMAALRCCRAWYSVDAETSVPARVPPGVRLAYLQVDEDERPEQSDLLFRTRRLRSQRTPLSVVCPNETPAGRSAEVTCGSCQRCFR